MKRENFIIKNNDMLSELKNAMANELFVGVCAGSENDKRRIMLMLQTFNKYGVDTELVMKVLVEVETKMSGRINE